MKISNNLIESALQYSITEEDIHILQSFCKYETLDNIIYDLSLKLPTKNIEYLLIFWIISTLRTPTSEDKIINILNIIYKLNKGDIIKILESNNIQIHPQNIILIENLFINAQINKQHTFRLRHNLENISTFIQSEDWEKIYSSLHLAHTELKHCINFSSIYAFHILVQLKNKSELYKLISEVRDIPTLWGIFSNIDPSLLLNLTYDSNDHHVIFCTLSSLFPFEHREQHPLTENEEKFVAKLLCKCSYEKDFFCKILKIFNTYPSRVPTLQKALGKALAIANNESFINIYINSLYLYPLSSNDEGRKCIRVCLEEFERLASSKLKYSLYEKAFHVWSAWKFDIPKNGYLFDIKFCLLDYAVVKYYKNTFSDEKISFMIEKKIEEISDINNNWYESATEFTAQWYWHLSTLQPLFHLQMLNKGKELNYLQINKEYQFEKLDRFISIRIRS